MRWSICMGAVLLVVGKAFWQLVGCGQLRSTNFRVSRKIIRKIGDSLATPCPSESRDWASRADKWLVSQCRWTVTWLEKGYERVQISKASDTRISLEQARLTRDRETQSVFSEILASVGREGWQSADVAAESPALTSTDRAVNVWEEWYDAHMSTRYRQVEDPPGLGKRYGEILSDAQESNAYEDPAAFLKTLSDDGLATVQRVHHLADTIRVDQLNEEGALNLLLPPSAQVDLNHDGLTQAGAGYSLRFPDSTTPREVAEAWYEATAEMEPAERMIYELEMKMPVMLANIELDSEGRFVRQREPGDPDFVNPMASPDYSYVNTTSQWIQYLKAFRNQLDPVRVERDLAFWNDFRSKLIAREAQ